MSYGERVISNCLIDYYDYKYRLIPSWLHGLHLDFYIPSLRLGIEFDGYQHLFPISLDGLGEDVMIKDYLTRWNHDKRKNTLCKRAGINLLRIENYTKSNLKIPEIMEYLKQGLEIAKYLNKKHSYSHIIYEPHYITHFRVNSRMINDSLPVKSLNQWHHIFKYIKSRNYEFYILTGCLMSLYLHTKDTFKLTTDDLIKSNGKIRDTFKQKYHSIGYRNLTVVPILLKRLLPNYIKYLKKNNFRSQWLFPNPHNPTRHISFTVFSRFIDKVAKQLHLKHFNIYSLRKTGAYRLYTQLSLRKATFILNESNVLSTYKYIGGDPRKLEIKLLNNAFKDLG